MFYRIEEATSERQKGLGELYKRFDSQNVKLNARVRRRIWLRSKFCDLAIGEAKRFAVLRQLQITFIFQSNTKFDDESDVNHQRKAWRAIADDPMKMKQPQVVTYRTALLTYLAIKLLHSLNQLCLEYNSTRRRHKFKTRIRLGILKPAEHRNTSEVVTYFYPQICNYELVTF